MNKMENNMEQFSNDLQSKFQRLPNETDKEYIQRVVLLKDLLGCSWKEFADVVEKVSGVHRDESRFRKTYNSMSPDNHILPDDKEQNNEYLEELKNALSEIKKERVKLADERSQNNAFVRRIAREESISEIAYKCAETVAKNKPLEFNPYYGYLSNNYGREAILLISDWHFGLEFENIFNKFSPEICRKRVEKLTEGVIDRCSDENVSRITVLNLSDLIAGRIHTQIRIQSREDVISQIMDVSEILSEMLCKFSETMTVEYYDCLDNHSRIEPNKNESLDLESLARFIPFYLRQRLKDRDVNIHDNSVSADIITCNVLGHNIVGVHGDKDKPVTALDKITLLTRKSYDLMCTAHLHHFSADEKCGCLTVGNGSLMGTDDYAMNLRLHSVPSQTLIISTKENVCDVLYKINL